MKNPKFYPRPQFAEHGISLFDKLIVVLAAENCKLEGGSSYQEQAEFCVEQAGEILRAREKYIAKENL